MSEPHDGVPGDGPAGPPPPRAGQPAPGGWGTAGDGQAPGYGQPQYGQAPGNGQPQYGQAPGNGQPQYGQPQYGQPQYGQPQYGQPQYAQPGHGQQPGGYRPPPVQRGIVPLRPLSLGEIFDGAFRAVRANPQVMFGLSAVVVTISVLLESLVQWYSLGSMGDLMSAPVDAEAEMVIGDAVGLGGGVLLSLVVTLVSTTILTGLLIISVSRSVIGQRISLADAWARAKPQIWRLLGLTLLILLLAGIVPALWGGAIVAAALTEQWGLLLGVVLVGGLGVIVYLVWISTRTLLATPALMLEDQRVVAGLKRGWALSVGSFWRLFGIYLLTQVIVGVVASLIVGPVTLLTTILALDPFGPVSLALSAVAAIVASVLTTPFAAGVVALLYIDLRIRREGLDVELSRAAEAAATDVGGTRA